MPDFRHLPLSQLILYCPSLLQATTTESRVAWLELYRRALVEQNQAAWDALMMRLWPALLYWIYNHAAEVSPAAAEQIAQRVISEFKRHRTTATTTHSPLPTYDQLLMNLQRLIEQLLEE